MKSTKYLRVLYADYDDDGRHMMTVMLGFSDIKVMTASTVAEARRLAQTENFDLYLLDSQFPDGSGLDLCRQLCQYAPRIPIIFYSGNAHKTDIQQGIAAGANAYLVKPISDEIVSTIFQFTGRAETSEKEESVAAIFDAVWQSNFQNKNSISEI